MWSCWVPPRSGQPPARARRAYGRHGRAGGGHGPSLSLSDHDPEEVDPVPDRTSPPAAYPRPQLRRAQWQDLRGPWGFAHDDEDIGRGRAWSRGDGPFDATIQVPYPPESELSGIHDPAVHPVVWYRRVVRIAAVGADRRVLLHFGGVDYRADVWVNGAAGRRARGWAHTVPCGHHRRARRGRRPGRRGARRGPGRRPGPAARQAGLATHAARHLVPPHDRYLAAGVVGSGRRPAPDPPRLDPRPGPRTGDPRGGAERYAGRGRPARGPPHPARPGSRRGLGPRGHPAPGSHPRPARSAPRPGAGRPALDAGAAEPHRGPRRARGPGRNRARRGPIVRRVPQRGCR